jgi:hypothetical protein
MTRLLPVVALVLIGCPKRDLDRDRIADAIDRCPSLAEDVDGFEDDDGCPDPDDDQDGVNDVADACPRVPEDIDGIEDDDGCPEDRDPPVVWKGVGHPVPAELPPPNPARDPEMHQLAIVTALLQGSPIRMGLPRAEQVVVSDSGGIWQLSLATSSQDECVSAAALEMAGMIERQLAQVTAILTCEDGVSASAIYRRGGGKLHAYRDGVEVLEIVHTPGPEFDLAVGAWWGYWSSR